MAALFGSSGARSESKNLVEFKAGKMYMKDKMVHPDKRKGLLYVHQSDDSLMHLCWKDRTTSKVEDDLIIFPDDIEFKHVPQCTTGRVYVLKFKSSSRKLFFWMQEPKTDKDDEFCKKVNENLNNPPTPGSNRSTGGGGAGLGALPADLANLAADGDIQSLLGNMSQQQLMQLFSMGGMQSMFSGGGRSSSAQSSNAEQTGPTRVQSSPGARAANETTPVPPRALTAVGTRSTEEPETSETPTTAPAATAAATSTGGGQAIALSDLQNILSTMNVKPATPVDLNDVLAPEAIIPLLAKPEVQEKLLPLLPDGSSIPKTEEELRSTVSSPQFRQAVSTFGIALASGDLAPVVAQFDIPDEAKNQASKGDVKAFAEALQAGSQPKSSEPKSTEPGTEPADKSEDVEMKDDSQSKD